MREKIKATCQFPYSKILKRYKILLEKQYKFIAYTPRRDDFYLNVIYIP